MTRSHALYAFFIGCVAFFGYIIVLGTNGIHLNLLKEPDGLLHVSYLDVGQGDATFIESPTGMQVLIDGGRDTSVLTELPKAMGYFDRTIDLVVATHPDMDHIGGLVHILKRYDVKAILMTDNESDTPAYTAFLRAVKEEGATVLNARRGQVYDMGSGSEGSTTLAVLFPDRDMRDAESNTSSIVLRLSYGNADFLFMGDSPQAIETYLVSLSNSVLQTEVLKVGHHGSRTSSAEAFIKAVSPASAIISAGKDNDYGHPHKEVMDILKKYNVATKNTADVGSIFLESDGNQIRFKSN